MKIQFNNQNAVKSNTRSSLANKKNKSTQMGGMTNGLGGRTNGMTNGLGGRTNGMTNGLGGRTNGMTNGLGGRTNGMTNGLGSGGPVMRSRRMDDSAISPFRISLIIVIAFLVVVPASFFMLAQNDPDKGVRIDADFKDWVDIPKFVDTQQYPIAALDIINYAATTNTAGTLFLYADTRDSWMSISYVDSLLVFLDADDNPATGYSVRGMGADYVAEIHGWGGAIKGKQMGVFSGSDQQNWSAWNWRGISAALSLTQLEIGIPGSTISLQTAHSFLFMTKRGDTIAEICNARIALDKSALVVRQIPGGLNGVIASDDVMSLELSATGPEVTVTAIDFTYSGVTAPAVSDLPATIPAGGTITLAVTAPITGLASGTFVDVSVSAVTSTGLSTILGERMTAYANAPPAHIAIDGAFGDWNYVIKSNNLDAASNLDIDIAQFAGVNSTSQAFFYLKVSEGGEMMGGSIVPVARSLPGEPGEPVAPGTPTLPAPLQRMAGEDITRIYIDTKPNGQNVNGISADFLIEIKGLEGRITSQKLYSLPGKTLIMNVGAANYGRELEVGIALDQIGYNGTLRYFIESTDWQSTSDRTQTAAVVASVLGTRGDSEWEQPTAEGDPVINVNTSLRYTTIQAAIDATETVNGHTIRVWSGYYTENVLVNKQLTIIGNGTANTTIEGDYGSGTTAVDITADWVNLTGFSVTGSGNASGDAGIKLNNVQNCRIWNNDASYNHDGIYLTSSSNNIIVNNTAFWNTYGGIGLSSSNNNNITGNNASYNNYGLWLISSSDNSVTGNSAFINGYGTMLILSDSNSITTCIISDNTDYGIYLVSSNSNIIFGNHFIDNANQAYDDGINAWNATYPVGGNYWSDYDGVDLMTGPLQNIAGADGFGDTPYSNIQGGAGAQDYYPIPEFQRILLPILLVMGLVLVAMHRKEEDDDSITCPSCNTMIPSDEIECPVCGEPLIPDNILEGDLESQSDFKHPKTEATVEVKADEKECPSCNILFPADESECPACGEKFSAEESWDELADLVDEDIPNNADMIDAHVEAGARSAKAEIGAGADGADEHEKPEIKHTMLFGGLALSAVGAFGVIGLRAGIVQPILGYTNPSPGIGSMELMGLVASMLPLAFGLLIILLWGIRNNPAYFEMEKARKTDKSAESDVVDEPETLEEEEPESLADIELEPIDVTQPSKIAKPETPTVTAAMSVQDAPVSTLPVQKVPTPTPKKTLEPVLQTTKFPKSIPIVKKAPEPAQSAIRVSEPLPPTKKIHEPTQPVKKTPGPTPPAIKVPESAPPTKTPEPIQPPMKAPESTHIAPKNEQAEKIRIERCEKMMSFAAVMPEDTEPLKALIAAGTPVPKFTEEVRKSVEKRKKIESEAAEKEKTARKKKEDEEAALLKELLVLDDELLDDEELEDLLLEELEK